MRHIEKIALPPQKLSELMKDRCPLKVDGDTFRGCCDFDTFLDGICRWWSRWFDTPPTNKQWKQAERDWIAGNTGWEAAHNAQRRVKEKSRARSFL